MFTKPPVGSTISVTTRHRNSCIHTTGEFCETTYSNVKVLRPEPWYSEHDFKVECDDKSMRFRTISLLHVIALSIKGTAQPESTEDSIEELPITGSKGQKYIVRYTIKKVLSCTCPQVTFRGGFCKHMVQVQKILNERE